MRAVATESRACFYGHSSGKRYVRFGAKADIYATEILGLLHPRLAQAFDEFRHPAGV
jgi:hypothetical protein